MAFRWDFWRTQPKAPRVDGATLAHLEEFLRTRRGVEVFLEQPTTMARPSMLLVASDGEWTRRSIESPSWGRTFAAKHSLPVYDAAVIGYPQRMRDYNARRKLGR